MIWAALGILGVFAVGLIVAWRGRGKSDAAGNGLEHAYLVFATIALGLLALPVALGWWLDSRLLMSLPLLLVLVPVALRLWSGGATVVRRLALRLRSTMPTPALRRLEWALYAGHIAVVEELLRDQEICPALGGQAVGRALVSAALRGRSPDLVLPPLLGSGADGGGPQAIQLAAERAPSLLPLLLQAGGDPTACLPSGDPLVFLALDRGDLSLAERLIAAGASPDAVDRAGWPLLLAHASGTRGFGPGNWFFVAKLLRLGADPTVRAPDGRTLADFFKATDRHALHPDQVDYLTTTIAGR